MNHESIDHSVCLLVERDTRVKVAVGEGDVKVLVPREDVGQNEIDLKDCHLTQLCIHLQEGLNNSFVVNE